MNETHPSIEQIVDYLHDELPAAEDAAMHAHLAECRSCDERRAEELALTEQLRAYAAAEERDLPPSVVAKIRSAIQSPPSAWVGMAALGTASHLGRPGRRHNRNYVLRRLWGVAARTAPTAIEAAYYVDAHAAMATIAPFSDGAAPAAFTSYDETR